MEKESENVESARAPPSHEARQSPNGGAERALRAKRAQRGASAAAAKRPCAQCHTTFFRLVVHFPTVRYANPVEYRSAVPEPVHFGNYDIFPLQRATGQLQPFVFHPFSPKAQIEPPFAVRRNARHCFSGFTEKRPSGFGHRSAEEHGILQGQSLSFDSQSFIRPEAWRFETYPPLHACCFGRSVT